MATPANRTGSSSPPQRSALIAFVVAMCLFFGAGFFGVWLAGQVAPASLVAPMIGLLTLPLAFIIGMHFWLGVALFAALWTLCRRLLRAQTLRDGATVAAVPPGAFVFVPVATVVSVLAGGLMVALGSASGALATLAIYGASGLAYGSLCWLSARSGYLPFPAE